MMVRSYPNLVQIQPLNAQLVRSNDLFSPSACARRAMFAVLFGYSIVLTVAGIPSLVLLKSVFILRSVSATSMSNDDHLPLTFLPRMLLQGF